MDYKNIPSTCSYCGCGCGVIFQVVKGKLVHTLPMKTHPISQGKLCVKGWNLHEHVISDKRLKSPMIKKDGQFHEASWDEAIGTAADKFKNVIKEYGPDSVGVLASAKVTNEENYLIQKFARAVIGTNNVDHCARLCHASTVVGLAAAFGSGAMTNSIDEIEDAACIFVIGSNTTACHPLVARRVIRAKEKGAKLIVADPRNIQLSMFADISVNQRLGSDVALLNGMMHIILKNGWQAEDYIAQRCEDFDEMKAVVEAYTPKKVEAITNVSAQDLEKMAEMYAANHPAAMLFAMGITQHTTGVDNVKSCCNLAMLCGNVGVPNGGVNPLRGQNNVQGACDMGGLPNVFPGYQPVTDPGVNEKFSRAWGKPLPIEVGYTITDMISAMDDGKLKALYIVGENPSLSDPDLNHFNKALGKLDFLVVQDIYTTETAKAADVLFAGVSVAEKDGTFTCTERRCLKVNKAIDPVGDALDDWEILCKFSTAMGYEMSYDHPESIFYEMASLTPSYAGMSHQRLGLDGLQWPCPHSEHPGTPYLHKDRFTRGKGKFHAVEYLDPAEMPDDEYPYFLTTGRMYAHFHTGTMTRVSPHLHEEQKTGYVQMNPEDAERLLIKEGEKIKVATRRGEIDVSVKISEMMKPGVLFIPFHFAESAANILTNSACDPLAKIPEFKVCAAKVEKAA
jgi:formate dehydrogenase alpha subunit